MGVYQDHGMGLLYSMFSSDTELPLTVSTEMVLVTACLIFKWIHQALFTSEEQKIRKRRTLKPRAIPGKYKNNKKEFNKTEELLDKARNIWIINNFIFIE